MKAAIVLGYTEKIWDNHEPTPCCHDKDWKELTKEEERAAKVLGYKEKKWGKK
jgi:hypothetical protein